MGEEKAGGLPVAVPILGGVAGIVIVAIFASMASSVTSVQTVVSPVMCPAGQQFTNESSKCRTSNDPEASCINFYCTDAQGQSHFPIRLLGVCAAGFFLPLLALSALSSVLKLIRGGGTTAPG
jgi:hypothetical protein